MHNFDFQAQLKNIYASFPQAKRQPVIGLTANFNDESAMLADRYYRQVINAGGTPVLIPPVDNVDVIVNTLNNIDALILTGGADLNPLWAGEEPSPRLHGVNPERDLPELLITQLAYNRQIPILGICRGMQTMAMALGGKVAQDIEEHFTYEVRRALAEREFKHFLPRFADNLIQHSQDAPRNLATQTVYFEPQSLLTEIFHASSMHVNSFHHQAVCNAGSKFKFTAATVDGVPEAMESTEFKPLLGVQWHPEWMEEQGLPLFQWLVKQAEIFAEAKRMHDKVLTLDTHCDTPMFFPLNVRFDQRDPRILVDLHKMAEGRQDATTMVAYLPQPKAGEAFRNKVAFDVSGPRSYADLIFDKIENIVAQNSEYVALARSPQQLYANKAAGKKSIVLGIENGLALENDLTNVAHFAHRGVSYITLCHNGDNDICDSARGTATHGGVSEFGRRVIEEMNRTGIMVDLSHGAESSFYDALEISRYPIVCSHSNCKALCDVPRNLSDEQLRALAAKGGVAHITLYKGFLRTQGEANIYDAMEHLEHAIKVMGIDHVGLGTDFDGDGGVQGIANSSEIINFTIQLLRRRFSETDIEKIWGGNWLRVMQQCKAQ